MKAPSIRRTTVVQVFDNGVELPDEFTSLRDKFREAGATYTDSCCAALLTLLAPAPKKARRK